ncbi:hypothetical protein VTK73DRAFT_3775 [Phialemonium thermophilum]|uniref:Uncharacterized protein n=1 Tax=Phialemonium thermophilum TaxID=223376 RepID=A0ABR3VET7_9PEZI
MDMFDGPSGYSIRRRHKERPEGHSLIRIIRIPRPHLLTLRPHPCPGNRPPSEIDCRGGAAAGASDRYGRQPDGAQVDRRGQAVARFHHGHPQARRAVRTAAAASGDPVAQSQVGIALLVAMLSLLRACGCSCCCSRRRRRRRRCG